MKAAHDLIPYPDRAGATAGNGLWTFHDWPSSVPNAGSQGTTGGLVALDLGCPLLLVLPRRERVSQAARGGTGLTRSPFGNGLRGGAGGRRAQEGAISWVSSG